MSVQPVQVLTVQPGLLNSPANLKTETWNSGVFDCCQDMHICCLGFWCTPCLGCQVSSEAGEALCLPLLDVIGGGVIPATALALRSSLRERYRIQGSIHDDCCLVTCCSPCSWCQMARELKARRRIVFIHAPAPPCQHPSHPSHPSYPPSYPS